MNQGIYRIVNTVNQKSYIGKSVDIERRWSDHRRQFRKGKHFNGHLQRSWDKYGEQAFLFEILEVVPERSSLGKQEAYWCRQFDSFSKGYNRQPIDENGLHTHGLPCPPEVRAKIRASKAARPYRHSEEAKERIRDARARQTTTEEERHRFGEWSRNRVRARGHHLSDETKRKLSEKNRGRVLTEDQCRKISEGKKGKPGQCRPCSEEHRRNIAEALRGRQVSEETKRKISESLLERARIRKLQVEIEIPTEA